MTTAKSSDWQSEPLPARRATITLDRVYSIPEMDRIRFGLLPEATVNRDPDQYGETRNARDAEMIGYLVDVLLLQKRAVFPSDESSPETRALENWGQVGRAMLGQGPAED